MDDLQGQLRRSSSFRTICEVHREINDLAEHLDEVTKAKLKYLVLEAFDMGKRMDAKLREYKIDWDVGFYQPNPDHRADSKRRRSS